MAKSSSAIDIMVKLKRDETQGVETRRFQGKAASCIAKFSLPAMNSKAAPAAFEVSALNVQCVGLHSRFSKPNDDRVACQKA